jgi:hypothetical protein
MHRIFADKHMIQAHISHLGGRTTKSDSTWHSHSLFLPILHSSSGEELSARAWQLFPTKNRPETKQSRNGSYDDKVFGATLSVLRDAGMFGAKTLRNRRSGAPTVSLSGGKAVWFLGKICIALDAFFEISMFQVVDL